MTHSSETSLLDCSTVTSVLSQPWACGSPTPGVGDGAVEQERAGGERGSGAGCGAGDRGSGAEERGSSAGERSSLVGKRVQGSAAGDRPSSAVTTGTGSLHKPKRKPAPGKPGSGIGTPASPAATPETLPSPSSRPLSSSSAPTENLNTNRNNSTCLVQPPLTSPFTYPLPSSSSPLTSSSPLPSLRFRDTPILRRTPRASSKYQTLPAEEGGRGEAEEGGRGKAKRRYSLNEGASKTSPSPHPNLVEGAPKLGWMMRNKRSQSMSGMLIPKEGAGDSDKGCGSDWILESTV